MPWCSIAWLRPCHLCYLHDRHYHFFSPSRKSPSRRRKSRRHERPVRNDVFSARDTRVFLSFSISPPPSLSLSLSLFDPLRVEATKGFPRLVCYDRSWRHEGRGGFSWKAALVRDGGPDSRPRWPNRRARCSFSIVIAGPITWSVEISRYKYSRWWIYMRGYMIASLSFSIFE